MRVDSMNTQEHTISARPPVKATSQAPPNTATSVSEQESIHSTNPGPQLLSCRRAGRRAVARPEGYVGRARGLCSLHPAPAAALMRLQLLHTDTPTPSTQGLCHSLPTAAYCLPRHSMCANTRRRCAVSASSLKRKILRCGRDRRQQPQIKAAALWPPSKEDAAL